MSSHSRKAVTVMNALVPEVRLTLWLHPSRREAEPFLGNAVSRKRPDDGTRWTESHRNWHARHMSRAGIALVVRRHVDYKRVSSAVCLPTR